MIDSPLSKWYNEQVSGVAVLIIKRKKLYE